MAVSLLIEFEASFPEEGESRIFSADFAAEELARYFDENGIAVKESDIWNDFGWYLVLKSGSENFGLYLAKYSEGEKWQCTVEPLNQPNIVQRLLGVKGPSYLSDLKGIGSAIEGWLNSSNFSREFEFCLSNKPKYITADVSSLPW